MTFRQYCFQQNVGPRREILSTGPHTNRSVISICFPLWNAHVLASLIVTNSILTEHPAGVWAVWGSASAILLNFSLTSLREADTQTCTRANTHTHRGRPPSHAGQPSERANSLWPRCNYEPFSNYEALRWFCLIHWNFILFIFSFAASKIVMKGIKRKGGGGGGGERWG